jgi:GNAT superfamily N-acetyltransferase
MNVIIAKTDEEILKCWEVMHELRPHLEQSEFLPRIKEMISEGYILAFIGDEEKALAAIGFRYLNFLYIGKHFYIDDLTTLPSARGRGLAGKLLDFVVTEARQRGYSTVTLDSGYGRNDAHRLYLNKGFKLNSHHFLLELKGK